MRTPLLILLVIALLTAAGCVTESTGPEADEGAGQTILRATITGKIIDFCTNRAVEGAVISVGYDGGVARVVSDSSGSFSFGDVPVSRYEVLNGQLVANDIYVVTASLVNYNQKQTSAATRYRDYYYATSRVTYTSASDSSGVMGLIGSVNFAISELNSQITGTVVDKDMQPVSGAIVTLFDNTIVPGAVLQQAITSASGGFVFNNVDNGIVVAISAQSADGSLQGNLAGGLAMTCNLPSDSLRAHVLTERIRITAADNVAPFVISISPQNGADVSPTAQVVYVFSEPIRQTPYTRTDLGVGHGTIVDDLVLTYVSMKKGALRLPITVSWNSSYTQLSVTSSDIVGSAKYTFDFTTAATKLQDRAGNALVNNTSLTGDFEVLNFTTAGGSALPGAPVLSRRLIGGLYADLDFTGGTVSLTWSPDAAARSYNIYRKSGEGAFELIAQNVYGLQYNDTAPALVAPYNPGLGQRDPLASAPVRYIVYGVSRDLALGPPSNSVTVADAVKPLLITGTRGAAVSTLVYPFTLQFSEPLSKVPAEVTTNYTFSNTGGVTYTVQRADYLGWQGASYVVRLTVSASATPVAGAVLTISNNVVDLSGNSIDSAANSQTF